MFKKSVSIVLAMLMLIGVFAAAPITAQAKTTTDYRYGDETDETFSEYSEFSDIAICFTPLPGLEKTDVITDSGIETCDTMVPQGICVAEDYILITAYCRINEYLSDLKKHPGNVNDSIVEVEKNHHRHNSVIYVLDLSGKYLKTLTLDDDNHVGGIAYHRGYVWVAKSTDCQLSAIPLESIDNAVAKQGKTMTIPYYQTVDCGCTASFLTAFNDSLWVGVYDEEKDGSLNQVNVCEDGDERLFLSKPVRSLPIECGANGATFAYAEGNTYLTVNYSYGRNKASKTSVYTVDLSADDSKALTLKNNFVTPPMAEEICVNGGRVFTIFESASTPYSTVEGNKCKSIVDAVCTGDYEDWFGSERGYIDTSEKTSGDYIYRMNKDGGAEIVTYKGSAVNLIIPDKIDNHVVTKIGPAFWHCTTLKSIKIPKTVISIYNSTFEYCENLESINIPDGIMDLDSSLFFHCFSLKSIKLPDSLVNLGNGVFCGCESLTSITVPENVVNIARGAFRACRKLNSISLPATPLSIGESGFYNCGYYNDEDNWQNGVLYIGKHLIDSNRSMDSYNIKSGTLSIAENAFEYNSLESITIPDSVKRIGSGAFYCNESMTEATIGSGVEAIGSEAFYGCNQLESLKIGSNVNTIGWYAFDCCTKLESVVIPKSVKDVSDGAFFDCSSLKKITIEDDTSAKARDLDISEKAFANTAYYDTSSNWENNILYIGKHLIKAKESISGSCSLKSGTLTVAECAFENCSKITSLTVPAGVKFIDSDAFSMCSGLKSVTIAGGLRIIGIGSFDGCSSLTDINFQGTEAQWGQLQILRANDELFKASFHFSFSPSPVTTITIKAAKTTIYVGESTTVKVTVKNPKGNTSLTSGNTAVATVSLSGVVKGKKAGTTLIKAYNNGKYASVKITVKKKANTLSVKAKTVTANSKKQMTFAKTKILTITKPRGKVTFAKSSGDKKITINKTTGTLTVKKGLKKGKTYSVKITVKAAGNTTYNAGSKTVTVKVKVK